MKKARMNISHSRFILFKLKIFGEIVTTEIISKCCRGCSKKEHKEAINAISCKCGISQIN